MTPATTEQEVGADARHMGLCRVTEHNRWRAPDAIESLKWQSLTCVCVCVCEMALTPKAGREKQR